jgi:hypothetical protein
MARSKTTAAKRQREQQKLTKARVKLERREMRNAAGSEEPAVPVEATETEAELMERLASLHRSLESGTVSMQEFEDRRELIRAKLEQIA